MSGIGRDALPDIREWSRGTPGCSGVSGISQEALPHVRCGWDALPEVREW